MKNHRLWGGLGRKRKCSKGLRQLARVYRQFALTLLKQSKEYKIMFVR